MVLLEKEGKIAPMSGGCAREVTNTLALRYHTRTTVFGEGKAGYGAGEGGHGPQVHTHAPLQILNLYTRANTAQNKCGARILGNVASEFVVHGYLVR